jgi:hypothetical protein
LLPSVLLPSTTFAQADLIDAYFISSPSNPLNIPAVNSPALTPLSTALSVGVTNTQGASLSSQFLTSVSGNTNSYIRVALKYDATLCSNLQKTGVIAGSAACQPTCYAWDNSTFMWTVSSIMTQSVVTNYASTGSPAVVCNVSTTAFSHGCAIDLVEWFG